MNEIHFESNEDNLFVYLVIFVKHKKFLLGYTFLAMIIFYLTIFFFVDEQFDSTALVVPAEDNSFSGLAGMLGDIGGSLPFGIGGASMSPDVGLYNTILGSRTTLEHIIKKFNLMAVYNLDKNDPIEVKAAREILSGNINAEETEDRAYSITVRAPDSVLSSNITNYILEYLNNKIIELKTTKSKNNRIFLGSRLEEVRSNLTESEDSLKAFQQKSGMLVPEEQISALLSAYAIMDKELMTKRLQKEVMENLYDKGSPNLRAINLEVEHYERKLSDLKKSGERNSIFIPYKNIPENAIEYYRLYREIEINSSILQFVLPLYEQAKIEEQKDLPVVQIIDYANVPEEKSFPARTIFTLLFGFGFFSILYVFLLLKHNKKIASSEEMLFVKKNLFRWNVR